MDLICYLHPSWRPLIRPGTVQRRWMDDTPESFAYRCLPLSIANSHGWEVATPCAVEAVWNGGAGTDAVKIQVEGDIDPVTAPVSIFGQGVLTFHLAGLFRTPPGWNLWVGGPPNQPKDGISALSGIVETDWSPFTFTMNWRFTRPHRPVRFEADEAIAFLFPVERAALESFQPKFAPLDSAPELETAFCDWSRSRDAFHQEIQRNPPHVPADKWQKHYYRGVDSMGQSRIEDHRTKLHVKPFAPDSSGWTGILPSAATGCPAGGKAFSPSRETPDPIASQPGEFERLQLELRKRDWILETMEAQRALTTTTAILERRSGLSADEFLSRYYASNRPVILTGEMVDWPALSLWSPEYLAERLGDLPVEYQGARAEDPRFEERMGAHRRHAPFQEFLDQAMSGKRNDVYMTAYNASANGEAMTRLSPDLGRLDRFLVHANGTENGLLWIGPAETFTPPHYDLTNNFIAQIVGRKRLRIAPPSETTKLYNTNHVYSDVPDLEESVDFDRFPRLALLRFYDIDLEPGEILFTPVGWWHQVRALSFSVTATYTDFIWPNNASDTYPYSASVV